MRKWSLPPDSTLEGLHIFEFLQTEKSNVNVTNYEFQRR
jgi:hypothetical protein